MKAIKDYKDPEQVFKTKPTKAPAAFPLPLPVQRAIQKLGNDLSLARRRRRFTQASMAERIGSSLNTVKRMEKGDPRVPLHFLARSLHVLGEIDRLAQLMDTREDPLGLMLVDAGLPKRIRARKHTGGVF